MADWFWHPKITDLHDVAPNVDDYRVFPCVKFDRDYANAAFCRVNAYALFKSLSIMIGAYWIAGSLWILINVITTRDSVENVLHDHPVWAIFHALCLGFTICSIAAFTTRKPVYAQLLFPAFLILSLCVIAGEIYDLVLVLQNGNFKKYNIVEGGLFVAVLILVLTVLVVFWCFALIYKFYAYMRDVQLHWEKTHPAEAAARLEEAKKPYMRINGVRIN